MRKNGNVRKGFASLSLKKRSEIARMGGIKAHKSGLAHEWTSEEARDAGRKGGASKKSNWK